MVDRGLYNEAFTKALMASDVPVVVDLMNMVDQNKIFPDSGTGCALEEKRQNSNSLLVTPPLTTPPLTTPQILSVNTPTPPVAGTPVESPSPNPSQSSSNSFNPSSRAECTPSPPTVKSIIPPPPPAKPTRTVTRLSSARNGYYADSEETLDRRKLKKSKTDKNEQKFESNHYIRPLSGGGNPRNNPRNNSRDYPRDNPRDFKEDNFGHYPGRTKSVAANYEKIARSMTSQADDFFEPIDRSSSRIGSSCDRPRTRLGHFNSASISNLTELESDTETKLEQFFLMNKYKS